MRIPTFPIVLVCLCVVGCASQAGKTKESAATTKPSGPVTIQQVIPFATADSVRFEVRLTSTEPVANVKVTAKIVPIGKGETIPVGIVGNTNLKPGATRSISYRLTNLKPRLWEPTSPNLYHLVVTASREDGRPLHTTKTRFGFRSFEVKDAQFHLNGRPIFLRGVAINPPARGIPEEVGYSRKFAEDYVRFMKSRGVNMIRMEPESPVWFDVCDEMGMLVFQGFYGSPPDGPGAKGSNKDGPPADFDLSMAGYIDRFQHYPQHPSIVIYVLANELPRIHLKMGPEWHAFIDKAHQYLKKWSPEAVFIGNAGYGEGREGDIADVHRYWGWYYNTYLTYFNLRNTRAIFGDVGGPDKMQPVTFSECVGNYTGVDGAYNAIVSRQVGAQLGWTGNSENQPADAMAHQTEVMKNAAELFRRLRPQNPRLAGLMPFTIFFHNWRGISSFDQMKPKPAMEQLKMSYAPVLLSWEMWTPQVYAGTTLRGFAHVVNDSDDGTALRGARIEYEIAAKGAKRSKIAGGTLKVPEVAYYGTWKTPFEISLPADAPVGEYQLIGRVMVGGKQITRNTCDLFIAPRTWKMPERAPKARIALYDPVGKTASALKTLGIPFAQVNDLASAGGSPLVIGEECWSDAISGDALKSFVREGGRLLVLGQEPDKFKHEWLPAKIKPFTVSANDHTYTPDDRPSRDQQNVNIERPWHPVFNGLNRYRLAWWSDYTGWDETKPGFPQTLPVKYGFKLMEPEALAHTAILADYDRGLEGVALCEMFDGKGSVMLSAFDLVDRTNLDPAADRLLANLVMYLASDGPREVYPLIEQPIKWADYPTERGLMPGPLTGMVVNGVWTKPPTEPNATPLPDNKPDGWNTDPGNQFVPKGRRPIGPFGYSNATTLREPKEPATGTGTFYARLPAGRKAMITTVRNNGTADGTLRIEINGSAAGEPAVVKPGETVTVRSPLPANATDVAVKYAGERYLVLEETAFE